MRAFECERGRRESDQEIERAKGRESVKESEKDGERATQPEERERVCVCACDSVCERERQTEAERQSVGGWVGESEELRLLSHQSWRRLATCTEYGAVNKADCSWQPCLTPTAT